LPAPADPHPDLARRPGVSGRRRARSRAWPGSRGHGRTNHRALDPRTRRCSVDPGGRADRSDAYAPGRFSRGSLVTSAIDPIRLAIPSKGHLYDGVFELLRTAGYKVHRASDRQYEATISGQPRFHVVFMRPTDIVIQVQEGRCHLGVTGMDVYA